MNMCHISDRMICDSGMSHVKELDPILHYFRVDVQVSSALTLPNGIMVRETSFDFL